MAFAGDRRALAVGTVRRIVDHVLDGERIPEARITVTFFSSGRMRGLNRRTFGRDRATDVIAFALPHGATLVGDVYVCPAAARASARRYGIGDREEMVRLVVHGVLHVLGHDHPDGDARTASPMWRVQERYVHDLMAARS